MLRIVLIGAGVSGGVIARGLQAIPDVEVTLIEQVSRQDHANAGNGLNIGPNALKALDEVLPEMADELRAASLPWTRWKAALVTGRPLYEIPLDGVADRPGIRIRWSELYRIAREAVAGVARYEQRFVGVEYAHDSRLTVRLEDVASGALRSLTDIDLVIACDGRYSRVRELCVGTPVPRHLRVGNFRLLIDDRGASGIADMEQWYNGPNRLLAFRLADGNVYLSGNIPVAASGEIEDEQKTAAGLRHAYLPAEEPELDVCRFLVEASCARLDALHWSRAQEIPGCFRDRSGHVLFVGDSAHAMAPTLGQGATQAIEDGGAFVALFRALFGRPGFSIAALTAAFERLRRDRVEFVRRLSWDASEPLLAGSDPVETNRDKNGPGFRAELRRLYLDVPLALDPDAAREFENSSVRSKTGSR
jgi:salicylate hydroxylase